MIRRDRQYFNAMAVAFEREPMYARRAWAGFEDRSATIEAHVRALETQVTKLMAQTSSLQTQLTAALGPSMAKMPPKRTTTTAIPMTDAAIKALIAQGVAIALAQYEANRGSRNGDDSHDSESGRRTKRVAR
ncbi:hypothetical protein Tco_1231314 [Tanacetum coccineum]